MLRLIQGRTACVVVVVMLLALFLAEGVAFIISNSQTADEGAHLIAGYYYVLHGDGALNPEYPPLARALAALPLRVMFSPHLEDYPLRWRNMSLWRYGREFLYDNNVPGDVLLCFARIPNLLLGTVVVATVGLWAFRLWGRSAGLVALALAAFEPTLLAHSSVVTTDVAQTLCVFLSTYLLWEYTKRPSIWLLLGIGIFMGAGLASKVTAILIIPILVSISVLTVSLGGTIPLPWACRFLDRDRAVHRLALAGLTLALVSLVAAGVLILVYGPGFIGYYWHSFRAVRDENGYGCAAFFFGAYSRSGWWCYFPVAFGIKTTVGTLFLIGASLGLARFGTPWTARGLSFLLLPVLIWFGVLAFARLNFGVRHVLPVYPFLLVVASRVTTIQLPYRWLSASLVLLPLGFSGLSSLRVAPHQVAYFNELVGGPGEGYRYLSDSNLDWGQDLRGLKRFMDRKGVESIYLSYYDVAPPAAFGIRHQFLPQYGPLGPISTEVLPDDALKEFLAIGAMSLQGVHFVDHDLYGWLRQRQPVETIGYSIFVYDVTNDVDAHTHMARIYMDERQRGLAQRECRRVLALNPGNRLAHERLGELARWKAIELFKIDPLVSEPKKLLGMRVSNLDQRVAENVTVRITIPAGLTVTCVQAPTTGQLVGSQMVFPPLKTLRPNEDAVYRFVVVDELESQVPSERQLSVEVTSKTFARPVTVVGDGGIWEDSE